MRQCDHSQLPRCVFVWWCGEWHGRPMSSSINLMNIQADNQTAPPECHSCNSPLSQPWACLTCEFVGCAPLHASTSRASRDCLPSHFANSTRCEFGEFSSSRRHN